MELTEDLARKFAQIALGHVGREYPNSPGHVLGSNADAKTPRELHPAFFGSYDWHSCVHSWWMLLTLRRLYPDMPEASDIDALADATFTEEKLTTELAYFERPEARGFERPYGWGWLLYLHHELTLHHQQSWHVHLGPLSELLAHRFREYLRLLTYPITVGTHFNTSFALTLALPWSRACMEEELTEDIKRWANSVFGPRSDYNGWEPGGDEFLSPVLSAANLMTGCMEISEFREWFAALVLDNGWLERKCHPVTVSDRSDGKIAHLDGLNLSRAWCLYEVSRQFEDEAIRSDLCQRGDEHLASSLPHVAGDYMGEHWLASFALLALQSRPDD